MTEPSITVGRVTEGEIERVEELLAANDLPHRDVRTKPDCFFVATADAECLGVGGVEIRGTDGLLRSVVVTEPNRGQGYGAALCDELEDYARETGVDTLYLLTTTASAFFRERGYEAVARESAPATVRRTTEFADLCPSSATCMRKALDD